MHNEGHKMDEYRKETIKTGTFYREANISLPEDVDTRTIDFEFSSEYKVQRSFNGEVGMELLDHSPEAVNLERMHNAPFLLNHDPNIQIGKIESYALSDGVMRGAVRFSKSALGEEIYQDYLDGIRSGISIGYSVNKVKREKEGDEVIWRVTDWTGFEVSSVSIPADPNINRSNEDQFDTSVEQERKIEIEIKESPKMEEKEINVKEIEEQARKAGRKAEADRVRSIGDLKAEFSVSDEIYNDAINNGLSADEFTLNALRGKFGEDSVKPIAPSATVESEIGLSKKETESYSIARAINSVLTTGRVQGFEAEVSDEISKRSNHSLAAGEFHVPYEAQNAKRVMEAEVFSTGGVLVDEDNAGMSMIELLRNKLVTTALGARNLSGLQGNVLIPKTTGATTAYWLDETAAVTASDMTLGNVLLSPHRLASRTHVSKQLVQQGSLDVESMIRDDIAKDQAVALDLASLFGSGVSGQPEGISLATGLNTVTFSTTPTWAKMLDFEELVAIDNADNGSFNFVTTAQTRAVLKATLKTAAVSGYLWENNEINGYPAMVSQQMDNNRVLFGDFSQLILGSWGGMSILVDPNTIAEQNQTRIIVNSEHDVAVRHGESFCLSTDAGNQ
jgi:HK97 family phage major capsid protein|tara:strand:+ start:1178 stop:3034 length:1857 start_codon:yes stop_codon:yes gene_type:complete